MDKAIIIHIIYLFYFKNGGKDLIDSLDKENRTPIHYAASKGSLQVCGEHLIL